MTEYTIKLFATSDGSSLDVLVSRFYQWFDGVAVERCGQWSLTVDHEGEEPRVVAIDVIGVIETIGFSVVRVDPDLVDIPEIAERLSRSRQAVHKWATGELGSAFPRPLGFPGGKRIWPWFEVLSWVQQNKGLAKDVPIGLLADDAAYVDGYLAGRRDRLTTWSRVSATRREVDWPAAHMRYDTRPLSVGLQ